VIGHHSGKEYADAITARQSDRRARSAFQNLVVKMARPGGAIFDFGAGPGIDARFYADRGLTVEAYDVDPAMREYFSVHCRDYIQAGRITLHGGTYREFLAQNAGSRQYEFDLVTSNFAPFNLVENLPDLFAKLHALTRRDGIVLASVLSPYFIGDLKYPWWWRNALRLWRDGRFSLRSQQGCIVRRRLADFAAQCFPYFTLERVYRGLASSGESCSRGIEFARTGRYAWMRVATCRFMILQFKKRATATVSA
jgi:SAM-dependent methyltransferase